MNDWERLLPYLQPYTRHFASLLPLTTRDWLLLNPQGQPHELYAFEAAEREALFSIQGEMGLSRWWYLPEQVTLTVQQNGQTLRYGQAFYDGHLLLFRSPDRQHYLLLLNRHQVKPSFQGVLEYLQQAYKLPLHQPPYFGVTQVAPTPVWQQTERPKTPAELAAEAQALEQKRKKTIDNLERALVIRNVLIVAGFLTCAFWLFDRIPAAFAIVTLVLGLVHQLLVHGYEQDLKRWGGKEQDQERL